LIKYIKSVLWRVAKRLSYIHDARCLKVNDLIQVYYFQHVSNNCSSSRGLYKQLYSILSCIRISSLVADIMSATRLLVVDSKYRLSNYYNFQ